MLPLLLLTLACSGSDEADDATAKSDPDAITAEQLAALGYLEVGELEADPTLVGVRVLNAARTQPGYRLYVSSQACEAELLESATGEVVASWRHDARCHAWSNAELVSSGDVLVPSRARPRFGGLLTWDRTTSYVRELRRYAFDGSLRAAWDVPAHHDAEEQPDGSIWVVNSGFRQIDPKPDAKQELWLADDHISHLSAEGELLRSISMQEVFDRGGLKVRNIRPITNNYGRRTLDRFHVNAVTRVDDPSLPPEHPFAHPGALLVTIRHQDRLVLIDPETADVLWSWGDRSVQGPHDGQLLPNGNVLVFDNGVRRSWSRVLELDPITDEIVWSYGFKEGPDRFFTKGRGSAQRLPNGNTLIANSNEGEAFEVTPEGEVVWRFYNPRVQANRRASIVRMKHYDEAVVAPLLAR